MPKAGHELGERRTRRRGQHRTAVPQVVEPQVGSARDVARAIPVPVKGRWLQVPATVGWEDERVTAPVNVFR